MPYNYSTLTPDAAQLAQSAAGRIKKQTTRLALAAIEIGSDLLLVKGKLPHGQWERWLRDEFGWEPRHAQKYMRVADKFAQENVTDLAIGLRTLEYLARDSVSDDDRAAALSIARENGGSLTFTSAADLLGGTACPPDNPAYSSSPPSQIIIFDDDDLDDLPPDNPDDYVTYESSLPIGRMTLTRTTETVTETAELDVYQAVQQPLPSHLMDPIYYDPVMRWHEPEYTKTTLDMLAEIWYLKTGQRYSYTPRGE
jgi:hypothetical protein